MTELSRRSLLRGSASLALGFAFSGALGACGRKDSELAFFNWQDYIDPTILDDFAKTQSTNVSYTTYASNDELADRLLLAGVPRRGNRKGATFDVIVPSDNLFRRLRDESRLKNLDRSIVTTATLANIDPEIAKGSPDPTNEYAIPWATGTTGIGYDSTVFATPPDWSVFLDNTHAGKMSLLNERREAFASALFSLGLDANTTNQADIDKATEQLTKMKPNIAFDSETYLDKLTDGGLVAAQAFSTDVAQARRKNPKLAFVVPPRGGIRWIDLLCVPNDAREPSHAFRFINYYLTAEVSARNAKSILANTANTAGCGASRRACASHAESRRVRATSRNVCRNRVVAGPRLVNNVSTTLSLARERSL